MLIDAILMILAEYGDDVVDLLDSSDNPIVSILIMLIAAIGLPACRRYVVSRDREAPPSKRPISQIIWGYICSRNDGSAAPKPAVGQQHVDIVDAPPVSDGGTPASNDQMRSRDVPCAPPSLDGDATISSIANVNATNVVTINWEKIIKDTGGGNIVDPMGDSVPPADTESSASSAGTAEGDQDG